jgi:ubiquinone/menaquinone biosynthesis C-methylase UbiE
MTRLLQRAFWSLYGRFVWDAQEPSWRQARIEQVTDMLLQRRRRGDERVLDAGCGTGHYAVALAQAGFQALGIDYAPGMLAHAQARLTPALSERLNFRRMDLDQRLDLADASFDHVINISVLQNVADPAFTLRELWRVLRPGGALLLLHVPRPQSLAYPLREVIRHRVAHLQNKSIGKAALVAAKAIAERTTAATYWTSGEVAQMLRAAGFDVVSLDEGPPIIVIAERGERCA